MAEDTLLTLLDLHQARRLQGLPALSVLIGEPADGLALWRRWASRQQRPVLDGASNHDPEQSLRVVLGQWCRHLDSGAAKLCLAGKTEYELRTLLRTHMPTPVLSAAELRQLHHLLQPGVQDSNDDREVLTADPWHLLLALAALGGVTALPALVFSAPGQITVVSSLVEGLYGLATARSDWPIAVLMDSESHLALQREAESSRALALIEEGVVFLGRRESTAVASALPPAALRSERFADTLGFLNTLDPARPLTNHFEAAVAALTASEVEPGASQLAARVRSEAERFLFECLQALPETRNLFRLNVRLPVKFGTTNLEVDLLARSHRLAVEVDGYYHFQNVDAYRRDRRKDLLLQRQGYIVVRVLATDVVERMPSVLDTIKSTLSHQAGTR